MSTLGLLVLAASPALGAPYSWTLPLPHALRAPTDRVQAGKVVGASLQGGLVDIRYGQAALDLGGWSQVLEVDKGSSFTLDGKPISAEGLQKQIPAGLAAVARYDPHTGHLSWLDAFSYGSKVPQVDLKTSPPPQSAYRQGQVITVRLSSTEARRLAGSNYDLALPGLFRSLPLTPSSQGGFEASFQVMEGWNLSGAPLLLKIKTSQGVNYARGPKLSLATTPPQVLSHGPLVANARQKIIEGWVDVRSESKQINPSTAKLITPQGCRVLKLQPRVDRTIFTLETDGPGDYPLSFSIADHLGNRATKQWVLRILP